VVAALTDDEHKTAEQTGKDRLIVLSEEAVAILKWIMLEKLNAKESFFSSDERGRVYHNVACLWSEFRPFLRLNGRRLANLDIRNSQPLFFALCLRDHCQQEQEDKTMSSSNSFYYSDAPKWRVGLDSDVKRYIRLVE
jgi:hypothetical protein